MRLPSLDMLERLARATGRPFTLPSGAESGRMSVDDRRARVRRVLGSYRFNPWEREPTGVEARTLVSDGLTRERFEGQEAASAGGR